jgi:hydroxylamine reductase (hybrid-cluster protein)
LAQKWEIPILLVEEDKGVERIAGEAFKRALDHQKKKVHTPPSPISPCQSPGVSIFGRVEEVRQGLKTGKVKGILVIWGEPNVKQAFFERTLSLMESALNSKLLVLVGGEAVAQAGLLNEELARRMGKNTADIPGVQSGTLWYLQAWGEIPRLVSFLKALNSGREFLKMPLVVSFPELVRSSTWAAAVSFLSMGFAVQLGTQLPFWGSPSLSEILLRDWPKISGGALLASHSLPDGQTQAREMISHIQSRSFEK